MRVWTLGILFTAAGGAAAIGGTLLHGCEASRRRTSDFGAAGGTILPTAVTVTDLSGVAIPGANVVARWLTASGTASGGGAGAGSVVSVTDAHGIASLPLHFGDYIIDVVDRDHAAGYVFASRNRASEHNKENHVSVVLAAAATVTGAVIERETRAPVAGAVVWADGELPIGSTIAPMRPAVATSRADGTFTIYGLRPGRIRIRAHKDALSTNEATIVPLAEGATETGVAVWLDRGSVLSGSVVTVNTTRPVAGVWMDAQDLYTGDFVVAAQKSTEDGQFRIGGLHSGLYALGIRGEGYRRQTGESILITSDGVVNQRVVAESGVTVSGRVEPAVEATIRWERMGPTEGRVCCVAPVPFATMDTAADGQFDFHEVERGTLVLSASTTDGRQGRAVIRVGDVGVSGVSLPLVAGGSVSGAVVDSLRGPVAGAWVTVSTAAGGSDGSRKMATNHSGGLRRGDNADRTSLDRREFVFRYVPTSSEGAFVVNGLPPGLYGMHVFRDDQTPLALVDSPRGGFGNRNPLVVVKSDSATEDVQLAVRTCAETATGTVETADGTPAGGVWVAAWPASSDGPAHGPEVGRVSLSSALSDKAGRFALTNLCRGPHRLVARDISTGTRGALTFVRPGTEVAAVRLEEFASLRGHVRFGIAPVRNYVLCLDSFPHTCEHIHDDGGQFRVTGLDRATYQLTVKAPGGYATTSADLRQGDRGNLAVSLLPWSSICGRLVAGPQEGLNGIAVTLSLDSLSAGPPIGYLHRTVTDGQGRFAFNGLFGGKVRLSFGDVGRVWQIIHTESAGAIAQSFDPKLSLSVTVPEHEDVNLGAVEVRKP